jgi:hypothetical protein
MLISVPCQNWLCAGAVSPHPNVPEVSEN